LNLSLDSKYAQAGLLKPFALEDQPTHQVTKQPDMVGSSQQSNKPLIDLNEDSQNVNSTVDLANNKEPNSEWGRLLAELHDMVSYLITFASIIIIIILEKQQLFGLNGTNLMRFRTNVSGIGDVCLG
jgi:hypothetical protein